jgi:hypothetical protein
MIAGNNGAVGSPKMAKSRQWLTLCPLLLTLAGILAQK